MQWVKKEKKKLAIGNITYKDVDGLKRMIDSVYENVDRIFVIDGKYADYEGTDQLSEDGTREMVEQQQYRDKVVFDEMPNTDQPHKRSRYLELAGQYGCDFLLVVDSDEYVINKGNYATDWKLFRTTLDESPRFENRLNQVTGYVHNIAFEAEPGLLWYLGKLIYKPGELYYGDHWRLFRRTDGFFQKYQNMGDPDIVRGLTMSHDENKRKNQEDRLRLDTDYQWLLERKEGAITEEEFNDPKKKAEFVEHNIHEMRIWLNRKEEDDR